MSKISSIHSSVSIELRLVTDADRQPQYRASIASRGKNDVIYDATRLQLKATIILRLKPCSQRRTEVKWSGVKRANCSSIFIRGFHSSTPVREQQPFCSSAANQLRDADARDLVQLRRVTGSTRRGSVQFSSALRMQLKSLTSSQRDEKDAGATRVESKRLVPVVSQPHIRLMQSANGHHPSLPFLLSQSPSPAPTVYDHCACDCQTLRLPPLMSESTVQRVSTFQRVLHYTVLHAAERTVLDLKPRDRVTRLSKSCTAYQSQTGQDPVQVVPDGPQVASWTHAGLRLGSVADVHCTCSICTACFVVRRPRCAADPSTNRRHGFLCRSTASMEHAADTAEAAAVDHYFSSSTENILVPVCLRIYGHWETG